MTTTSSAPKLPVRSTSARSARRARDWATYDRAQVSSGRLTLWLEIGLFRKPKPNGRKGRDQLYSDELVLAALALKKLFRPSYRRLEGLVRSLAELSGHRGPSPDYSSLCKRARRLAVPRRDCRKGRSS